MADFGRILADFSPIKKVYLELHIFDRPKIDQNRLKPPQKMIFKWYFHSNPPNSQPEINVSLLNILKNVAQISSSWKNKNFDLVIKWSYV